MGEAMNPEGELQSTPERKVFGSYETIDLPVQSFVRLPQVRSAMNPELPNIKESIRTRGLINQIDVARMSADQLDTYIEFVNQTWRTDVRPEDYELQQQADDYYYVVVAGHTRTEAIAQLHAEADTGYDYILRAKVHAITDPQEIIALQLDENLHSTPAQEQRAIAVVETYQYGLQQGMWANQKEFMREAKGKFSPRVLNDALGFAQLPPEARDFVFSGRLSYNAAVAIGRATGTVLDYVAARMGYGTPPERLQDDAAFEEAYRSEVALLIMEILNRRLNGTAAKKYVEGQESLRRNRIMAARGEADDAALFTMVSPAQQQAEYTKSLEADLRKARQLMASTSIEAVETVQHLLGQLTGKPSEALLAERRGLEAERQQRTKLLSGPALAETVQRPAPPLAH